MRKIQLTQGKVALVDDEDYEWINQWSWCAGLSRKTGDFYAKGWGGTGRMTSIHRIVMNAEVGDEVDHQNHNTLDCRKVNLLLTKRSGNAKNILLRRDNKSGVCGVFWDKRCGKWRVSLQCNNEFIHIGRFKSKEDAIEARRHANVLYGFHPNHGCTNKEVSDA